MDRLDMDVPDMSYSDTDRELLASPDPSMRRGILPSSGPRPSRQSQQNVLVVQTAETVAPALLPASPGDDVEEVDDHAETTSRGVTRRPAVLPQYILRYWH